MDDDDVGSKRGRRNFVGMMKGSASNDESNDKELGSPNKFNDSEASSYESNDKEALDDKEIDELDDNEAFNRPNHKRAKSTTDDAQGNAHEPLAALPTRPTVSIAATDMAQSALVRSLLAKSMFNHSGYARDIPQSVVVQPSLSKPTGSTLIHSSYANRRVPSSTLPTIPTAFHSNFAREVPLGVPITVRSTTDVREVTRQGLLHNHMGGVSSLGDSYGHNVAGSSGMHQMLNGYDAKSVASQIASHGVEFLDKLLSYKVPSLTQEQYLNLKTALDPASVAPGLYKDAHQGPEVTVAVPSYGSKQHINYVNRRCGRLRRAKITERFRSLQEILPNCNRANRDDIMDDVIDYIKHLQLQLKSLSQSTLADETTGHNSIINLQGFGHYLVNQGTLMGEPLEVMIGRLMEANKPAFAQFLESRGLYVKPMALAGGTFHKP